MIDRLPWHFFDDVNPVALLALKSAQSNIKATSFIGAHLFGVLRTRTEKILASIVAEDYGRAFPRGVRAIPR